MEGLLNVRASETHAVGVGRLDFRKFMVFFFAKLKFWIKIQGHPC